jgi:phenylpyruvate tautomerase PptA (4-oxalocrotonate tautomerase family)
MPIIEIHPLPPSEEIDIASALARVTSTVAAHLGEEPRGTWALWHAVDPGAYAEGADSPCAQPRGTHPAIVDVFAGRRDHSAELMKVVGRAVVRPSASTTATSWSDSPTPTPIACTGATERYTSTVS